MGDNINSRCSLCSVRNSNYIYILIAFLQDIAKAIEELNPTLTKYMLLRNRYLDESTPEEMHQIDINLTNMRSKWNVINKDYKMKYFTYEANSNVWKQFHDYMAALSVFLTNAESQLDDTENSEEEAKVILIFLSSFSFSFVVENFYAVLRKT